MSISAKASQSFFKIWKRGDPTRAMKTKLNGENGILRLI
jgi:hypothetical protein